MPVVVRTVKTRRLDLVSLWSTAPLSKLEAHWEGRSGMVSQLPRAAERRFFLSWLLTSACSTLSDRLCCGTPWRRKSSATSRITSCDPRRLATTDARHSRVYSSSTFKIRNSRPSCVRSAMKSYDQTWLQWVGRRRTQAPSARQSRARLGCFCGTFSPSWRQIVYTPSYPTSQPSRCHHRVTVRYP